MKKIFLVGLFLFAFLAFSPNGAVAQADSTFRTLEECQEAYDNGTYRVYQSRYRSNARKVSGMPTSTLSSDSCVRQDVVNGTGANARWTVQDTTVLFVFSGKTVTHRADCGNKVYDVVSLQKKTIAKREAVIDCEDGYTWDAKRQKCVALGQKETICEDGYTWDAQRQKCVTPGQTENICPDGYDYDDRLNKCVVMAETANCPKGTLWDTEKRECVKKGGGKKNWIIGGLIAGGVITAAVIIAKKKDKDCPPTTGIIPRKTLPTTGSQVPIRPSGGINSPNIRLPGGNAPVVVPTTPNPRIVRTDFAPSDRAARSARSNTGQQNVQRSAAKAAAGCKNSFNGVCVD